MEAQWIQFPGGEQEYQAAGDGEAPTEATGEQACRNVARLRARILRVDFRIHQPVERHRRGARAHHGDYDPEKDPGLARGCEVVFAKRQECACQRERQREHGMLEADHIERQSEAFQEHAAGTLSLSR